MGYYKAMILAAGLLGSAWTPLSAQTAPAPHAPAPNAPAMEAEASALPATLAQDITALLERSYPDDGPGAAVVVMHDGEIIYSGGQGLANIDSATPITADTVFRFASITKQFTAATILQLAAEGKLSLDDPLAKFLPDYPGPGAEVTVRHLLNHTSGIQSYTDIPGWTVEANAARPVSTAELIAVFSDQPMQFAPGTKYRYNNSGYVLLGAIIEKLTGMAWDEAIVARIATPLGLSSVASFADEADIPGMALGYSKGADGAVTSGRAIVADVPHAAGALRGTVGDLSKWARALHGGKVVTPEYYAMMTRPTILADGKQQDYGFGLSLDSLRGMASIGHSGGIFGFTTDSIYLPDADIFVAAFANSDAAATDPAVVMRRIAAMALNAPFEAFTAVEPDMEALDALFGVYQISDDATREFYARDGKLYTLRSGGSESEVLPAGDNRFFYGPNSLTWFSIAQNADDIPVMAMHQNGSDQAEMAVYAGAIVARPMLEVSRDLLSRYVGTYATPMGPMIVALDDEGVLTGKLGPQPSLVLSPNSETEFSVQSVDATVTFTVDGDSVPGLTIEQGGQTLPAERVGDTTD